MWHNEHKAWNVTYFGRLLIFWFHFSILLSLNPLNLILNRSNKRLEFSNIIFFRPLFGDFQTLWTFPWDMMMLSCATHRFYRRSYGFEKRPLTKNRVGQVLRSWRLFFSYTSWVKMDQYPNLSQHHHQQLQSHLHQHHQRSAGAPFHLIKNIEKQFIKLLYHTSDVRHFSTLRN